jgi:hypothetical protein
MEKGDGNWWRLTERHGLAPFHILFSLQAKKFDKLLNSKP